MLERKLCVNYQTCTTRQCPFPTELIIRIQELEKEREDIMSHFETQLNTVLAGVPIGDDDSRPPTPVDDVSLPRNIALRSVRPGTSNSAKSNLSKYTVESNLSVLGAAKGVGPGVPKRKQFRPNTASTLGKFGGEDRADNISNRIASINAKVRLYCEPVDCLLTVSSKWH